MSQESSGGATDEPREAARPSQARSVFDSCETMFFREGEAPPSPPAEVDTFADLDEGYARKRRLPSRKVLLGLALAGASLAIALGVALVVSWHAAAQPATARPATLSPAAARSLPALSKADVARGAKQPGQQNRN